MNTSISKTITAVIIFSIAMAALEGAVVVYLRALYYPGIFTVALKVIDEKILMTEITREAATIVMLLGIGYVAGKNFKQRFAYFLLSFATWDIFYYLWLKIFINWPSSIFEWDILFLIPVTWLGPVLAPLICSVTMILLAVVLLRSPENQKIPSSFWGLLMTGCALIFFTFIRDYVGIIISHGFYRDYANIMQNQNFISIASQYVPTDYSWFMFWAGEMFIGSGIILLQHSMVRTRLLKAYVS